MTDQLTTSSEGGIFTIVLNNPRKHNCMGFDMLYAIRDAVSEAIQSADVQVIVFRGAGERSFSTGANLKEFNALEGTDVDRWIRDGNEIFNLIEQSPKPTIAVIHGYAMGGGLELALACDFRIATDEAIISAPEVRNGWLPGWGGIARLKRLLGEAAAKQIVLLAAHLNAQQAANLGLFTLLVPPAKLEAELAAFIENIQSLRPKTYAMAKSVLANEPSTSGQAIDFDIMAAHQAKAGLL